MTPRYAQPVKKLLDGPPAKGEHADDDPPPGKDWVRFDFPPGSTPEQIARILMESMAKHPPKGKPDDA